MKYGTHALSLLLVGAAVFGASASCAGPGAGQSAFTEGTSKTGSTPGTGDDDDTTKKPAPAAADAAPAGDKVFGTSTFTYQDPGQKANDQTGPHAGILPVQGKNCTVAACHLDAKPWAFAGTVYTDATGTGPVAQAEIGIVYADNTVKSAMTDSDGNFWYDSATDFPPAGAKVGIRKAGGATKYMNTPLPAAPAGRACQSTGGCHGDPALRINVQ